MKAVLRFACLCVALSLCAGDVYMHNPRGSNNRLNEKSANRNNADRLFDSQNNNRGGYNAGDTQTGSTGFSTEDQIYHMKYFQSASATGTAGQSKLTVEWTAQHGCGGNEDTDPWKPNCNIVIQVMLQNNITLDSTNVATRIHDGTSTDTQTYQAPPRTSTESSTEYQNRAGQVQTSRGLHESFSYYDDCYMRTRNKGLFTADQNLANNNLGISSAIYTRQNPNGNRRGYECPEERDYYPYWHPSPWIDIAVLTDNKTLCALYQAQSFNVQPKGLCRQPYSDLPNVPRSWSVYNNRDDCVKNGGSWWLARSYIDIESIGQQACINKNRTDGYTRYWDVTAYNGTPTCLVAPNPPACEDAPWSRVNHLGNGRSGVPLNYTWTIPYFPSGNTKLAVVRLRYNISTDDYNPWATDASKNQNPAQKTVSPVTQNPYINIGSTTNKPLRLAINTAQFGRTFQDRSHLMELMPRPASLKDCTLYNLNVRGKRGNIVQVYPAVEYDFIPNRLTVSQKDCVHIQWTGSNTHNNGNPAGDGQAGDAGEGLSGTDRSNILQAPNALANYPIPFEKATMFNGTKVLWVPPNWTKAASSMTPLDVSLAFASVGNFQCYSGCTYAASTSLTGANGVIADPLLNAVTPSFPGMVLQFAPGNYYYLCTRNNNFSNRSQKGQLTVTA